MNSAIVLFLFTTMVASSTQTIHNMESVNVEKRMRSLSDDKGLSREELKCNVDSQMMYDDYPDLQQILLGVKDNMVSNIDEVNLFMDMGFKEQYVTDLKAACDEASGLFAPMNQTDFICGYMGVELEVQVDNFVQCLANTVECHSLDQILFLEEIWDSQGLDCRLEGEPAPSGTSKSNSSSYTGSSYTTTSEPSNAFMAGVFAGKITFLLTIAGVIVFVMRRSERSNNQSYASYEMSTQKDRTLT